MNGERETVKSTQKREKKKRVGGIAAFSLLITLFDKLGEKIYEAFLNGFFGKIFTSYKKTNKTLTEGFFGTYVIKNTRIAKFFRKLRKSLAYTIECCITTSLARSAVNRLCSFPLQYYGNFGVLFGVYSAVMYAVRLFIPWLEPADSSHIYTAIIIAVTSFPLLFSRMHLATAVKNSVLGRSIVKHALGFPDESFDNKKSTSQSRGNLMFFLGMLTGISTLFVNPLYIVITLFAATVIALIVCAPEIGVLLTIITAPFLTFTKHPTLYLAILVLVTAFFYVIKIIRGKRIFKLEALDCSIIIFGALILISSIYSAGGIESFFSALTSIVLMLGYFLLVNLMRTREWVKRCIFAFIFSASIASLIGIFEFVFGSQSNNWLDQSFHSIIKTRVISVFGNPNMLSVFLVMAFPFLLALSMRSRSKNERFLTRTLILILIACIIFTWSRAAWLALILGALLFAALYTKKSFRIFVVALCVIPIIPFVLPTSVLERFLSISNLADTSIAYRIYIWKGTFSAIKDYVFCGIGYGDSAFQTIYPTYAYSGIESAPHSHSLLLQLLLGLGIIGLIAFCATIFFSFQKSLEYIKNEKHSDSTIYVIASVVSIASALIIGAFDYIWYNPRIFYLFWIIIAIGAAFIRIGDSERARLKSFDHNQY